MKQLWVNLGVRSPHDTFFNSFHIISMLEGNYHIPTSVMAYSDRPYVGMGLGRIQCQSIGPV